GIGTVFFDNFQRVNAVAEGFRHLRENRTTGSIHSGLTGFLINVGVGYHTLSKKLAERFVEIEESEISQNFYEETAIEQMENGVFNSADVLIHRHPLVHGFFRERFLVVLRIAIAEEIP